MDNKSTYLLADSAVLPEVFTKVIEAKKLLSSGKARTVNEAVAAVGLSRSAFYKYRDHVFPFYETSRGRVITLFFVVEDFSGILSSIINRIARAKAKYHNDKPKCADKRTCRRYNIHFHHWHDDGTGRTHG